MFFWVVVVQAKPVSEQSVEAFFDVLDKDSLLFQRKVEPAFYHQYAVTRVNNFLNNPSALTIEQQEAVVKIEKLYQEIDQDRLDAIKSDAFEAYIAKFKTQHQEENVVEQLNFMSSPLGQSILKKQAIRQSAMQQLYSSLPFELSQQVDMQNAIRNVLTK